MYIPLHVYSTLCILIFKYYTLCFTLGISHCVCPTSCMSCVLLLLYPTFTPYGSYHVCIPLCICPTTCFSFCLSYYICVSPCVPLLVYSTPSIFCLYVPLPICLTSSMPRSVGVPLPMGHLYAVHSVCVLSHMRLTLCVFHSMYVPILLRLSRFGPFLVCSTPFVFLPVFPTLYVSHSLRIPLFVSTAPCMYSITTQRVR